MDIKLLREDIIESENPIEEGHSRHNIKDTTTRTLHQGQLEIGGGVSQRDGER